MNSTLDPAGPLFIPDDGIQSSECIDKLKSTGFVSDCNRLDKSVLFEKPVNLADPFRQKRCRHRLDMGDKHPPPPISKDFSEIFSPSHIKLTYNNTNKDFKSAERSYEVEKFKLDRKIFLSWKIKES